jgi:ADP-heptose:LPS heptosyltransferase
MRKKRVLVIKLGALGDLVLCFRVFASLRAHFPEAEIALLTAPQYEGFARTMPWFDKVLCDPRPSFLRLDQWAGLVSRVAHFAPSHVFDFQGKTRQSVLYALLGGPLFRFWSGAAPFCKFPRLWPPRKGMHYTDFVAAQLERAGVPLVDKVDTTWLDGSVDGFGLPARFALLIPGCAPSRLYKRWPAEKYAALAAHLAEQGIASVMVGTEAERDALDRIKALRPDVLDLGGKTSLGQIAALARRAELVIGNDTGPMHIAASVGARVLALMPADRVDPAWSAPRGERTKWIGGAPLADLAVEEVVKALGI